MDGVLLWAAQTAAAEGRSLFGLPAEAVLTASATIIAAVIGWLSKGQPEPPAPSPGPQTLIVNGTVHHHGSVPVALQPRRTALGWWLLLVAAGGLVATFVLLQRAGGATLQVVAPVTVPSATTVPTASGPTSTGPTTTEPATGTTEPTTGTTTAPATGTGTTEPTTGTTRTPTPTPTAPAPSVEPLETQVERFVQSWQAASRERRDASTVDGYFAFPADYYRSRGVRSAEALLDKLPPRTSSSSCRLGRPEVSSVRQERARIEVQASVPWQVPGKDISGTSPINYVLERAAAGQPFRIRSISEPPNTPSACR